MKTMKNMKQSRLILFVLSFLVMSIGNVYAQNVTVTGTVLDSAGEPVIGANVKVAGKSSVGTITDFEGNFSLSVPADTKKLEISYIGTAAADASGQSGPAAGTPRRQRRGRSSCGRLPLRWQPEHPCRPKPRRPHCSAPWPCPDQRPCQPATSRCRPPCGRSGRCATAP